jgi:hypothetical protein
MMIIDSAKQTKRKYDSSGKYTASDSSGLSSPGSGKTDVYSKSPRVIVNTFIRETPISWNAGCNT